MTGAKVAIAGAGAAGTFAAIACAEANPELAVELHEATAHPLAKVRISGGGRCNVIHAALDPAELAGGYPRGARELLGPLHRFGAAETVAWFAGRGVELKTEPDGRMFPATDDSATVVGLLLEAAERAGVRIRLRCGVASAAREAGGFRLLLSDGCTAAADRLLIATGGTQGSAGAAIARAFGHTIVPQVPSLFTFHVEDARLRGLEGVSVPCATVSAPGTGLSAGGPVLVTHWGLSGPAILRLSALGAREFHGMDYRFPLAINWIAPRSAEQARQQLAAERAAHPRRQVASAGLFGIPARLWERLAAAAGIGAGTTWSNLSNSLLRSLTSELASGNYAVAGKSLNKEEFVTCGGVLLDEVDFATMESRLCPGLHFAGEVLDIDGITGGYNLQAAWTTGWHAGRAMAEGSRR